MTSFIHQLQEHVNGEVHSDPISRHIYSVDASIFEIVPLCIVVPKTREDLIRAVKIAFSHRVPITLRGAATGITGACLGTGLIIDSSKYLNRILDINTDSEYAICEPGVVQDDLNAALSPLGYRLGPDTSTGNRATIGGMVANNSAGSKSLIYGCMVDHVEEVELVLSDGQVVQFSPLSFEAFEEKCSLPTREGEIYREARRISIEDKIAIEERIPKIPRRSSGYNLNQLIKPPPFNLSKIVVGSEGTLGAITKVRVKIVPKPKKSALHLIYFKDIIEAMKHVPQMLKYEPAAIELIDNQIIELAGISPSMKGKMEWLKSTPQALIIAEFIGEDSVELEKKLAFFKNEMNSQQIGYLQSSITDPITIGNVWSLRKSGLGILLSKKSYTRAIAFLEDISVSPNQLASFMEKFCAYLKSKGKEAGIYGHVGSGCMHVRPYINLTSRDDLELMQEMMKDISTLLLEFGGSLSGEHGDGLIRSWLYPKMFGDQLYNAFIALKKAFDPDLLMNPGKIVFSNPPFEELRISPESALKGPTSFLNFDREGGFELAVDLCNGNGMCRKKEGTMCPSFQVDGDEYHSTRARAQTLRAIVHGRLPKAEFTGKGLYDVLDLCISCKGCKTDCPSQVDMAKMKSEFLYHYQKKNGVPFRNYLFGYIGRLSQWMSIWPWLFNRLNRSWITKKFLSHLGISPKRTLPTISGETFSNWVKKQPQIASNRKVVLFNDTFTEFNHPEVGYSAFKVLSRLGFEVIVPEWKCCGRPMISKGLLPEARRQAEALITLLSPFAEQGIPIIGLEPSCILTIKDDYRDLTSNQQALTVIAKSTTFDEFIAQLIENGEFNIPLIETAQTVQLHGHCYQKALVGTESTLRVLNEVPGLSTVEIPSGCCGMAGSFGYEKEHYNFSMQIGELKLFPAIRKSEPGTLLVANGTSCRQQIHDGTGQRALHLAELLARRLQD